MPKTVMIAYQSPAVSPRIAGKTLDATHGSYMFFADRKGEHVIMQAWEVIQTPTSKEMIEICVTFCLVRPIAN